VEEGIAFAIKSSRCKSITFSWFMAVFVVFFSRLCLLCFQRRAVHPQPYSPVMLEPTAVGATQVTAMFNVRNMFHIRNMLLSWVCTLERRKFQACICDTHGT
jgi:hypothetical protein